MEKILDFEESKDWSPSKLYRFQCDCLSVGDAMDILIDEAPGGSKFIILTLDFIGAGLWSRLKYALQILRGRWTWREFVVREEDFGPLSEIFDPKKKFSDLP